MSLNWEFTDKTAFNTLSKEEKEWNDVYIWYCMFLDMHGITEENAKEWLYRYNLYNKLFGESYYKTSDGKPYTPTLADVKKRAGLHVNVSQKTRKQFEAKVLKRFAKEFDSTLAS